MKNKCVVTNLKQSRYRPSVIVQVGGGLGVILLIKGSPHNILVWDGTHEHRRPDKAEKTVRLGGRNKEKSGV